MRCKKKIYWCGAHTLRFYISNTCCRRSFNFNFLLISDGYTVLRLIIICKRTNRKKINRIQYTLPMLNIILWKYKVNLLKIISQRIQLYAQFTINRLFDHRKVLFSSWPLVAVGYQGGWGGGCRMQLMDHQGGKKKWSRRAVKSKGSSREWRLRRKKEKNRT